MTNLLALDQSSRITGWAVFQDGKLTNSGKFTLEDDDIGLRLSHFRTEVAALINKYDINEIAIEDIQMQNNVANNVQTFKILAEVFGIAYELATELKIPSQAVLASSWKSTLGIKGRTRPEQKKNAQLYVENTYGLKVPQDTCDAICIGTHVELNRQKEAYDWSEI